MKLVTLVIDRMIIVLSFHNIYEGVFLCHVYTGPSNMKNMHMNFKNENGHLAWSRSTKESFCQIHLFGTIV